MNTSQRMRAIYTRKILFRETILVTHLPTRVVVIVDFTIFSQKQIFSELRYMEAKKCIDCTGGNEFTLIYLTECQCQCR